MVDRQHTSLAVTPRLLGHECSGIVKQLGPNTEESGLKVGDRVSALCSGRFASTGKTYWTSVAKIPDSMSWEEAASIPVNYVTAYQALYNVARVKKGESLLIHAATGGAGQAAIILAQHMGMEIFATCSTAEKRDLLVNKYQIEPGHIFSSRDLSFAPGIMAKTNGKGVDVVLNSLSGPFLKATWDRIAPFGRFIEIGKVDLEASKRLDMSPFSRCATYAAVDTRMLHLYSRDLMQEALTNSVRICSERGISPVQPIKQYPLANMGYALRLMQSGGHIGKLVLLLQPDDQVNVVSRPQSVSLNDPNSTYLVAGGVGGISRSIVMWMLEKGAKNILLVSRSAGSHADAPILVQNAEHHGCNLQVSVTKRYRLSAESSHGAMVLDDSVLERMTYDQWQHAVHPKIAGSLNLHNHLPDLSFFIMLSSLVGVVGHSSQSNYAARNTFKDALARHRVSRGQPAVSIDLSAVKSAGFVAEQGDAVRNRIENFGTTSLEINDVLRLVEAAIQEPLGRSLDEGQLVTGLMPYSSLPDRSAVKLDQTFGTLRLASALGFTRTATEATLTCSTAVLLGKLTNAQTMQEATSAIAEAIASKLTDIFRMDVSGIDTGLPLSQYGVASLVAVELRNWLRDTIKAKASIFDILQSSSLNQLGALVASRSELVHRLQAGEDDAKN